ncbi:glycosyltransferase family 2 protein [Plastoroseomonas hellenica]|uniref:Glycosyltransferase family 2 protein n=1 Tax=Plastoroseomonas hellenica TaxID=2687306 RepID=A0ABS5F995_9PROT|nr:glycosyltransferase family 2 protein [Plastoroseomonas hellenica]MBR0647492.1 glycosyltransferase family 2 protein [Plastoroseomonas hellenica]MBR0669134.1 glycosyltransferase family 2 protein [Plastoroseomonas hellenica]
MKNPYADALAAVRVAVVIPCFRVKARVLPIIARIGPEVEAIYAVDDACPEGSGAFIAEHVNDPRVKVLFHAENMGVGGATMTGMRAAANGGADIIVKIDGDGQMDPALIPDFVGLIAAGEADYTKGNRFFEPESVARMPAVRLMGNAGLSFLTKLSTGYWHTMDPTNGYLAIHASLVALLPMEKIAKRYFFESDLLFRLSILTAKVVDIPTVARYEDECSGLVPHREILPFLAAHLRNFGKRILYNYFIRNFSAASVELVLGAGLLLFGLVFGLSKWGTDNPASAGTVMLAGLPVIVGFQLLLAALNYDIQSVPRTAMHPRLRASIWNGYFLRRDCE